MFQNLLLVSLFSSIPLNFKKTSPSCSRNYFLGIGQEKCLWACTVSLYLTCLSPHTNQEDIQFNHMCKQDFSSIQFLKQFRGGARFFIIRLGSQASPQHFSSPFFLDAKNMLFSFKLTESCNVLKSVIFCCSHCVL